MKLLGSCHCKAVTFEVNSKYPYPFNLCYCSICRKTGGAGGFGINLSADSKSLTIMGKENIQVYNAIIRDENDRITRTSKAERSFCKVCGSSLWLYDARWPEQIHPLASAIDSELPIAPEKTHLMLASKKEWVDVEKNSNHKYFNEYPTESIAQWHERMNLVTKEN